MDEEAKLGTVLVVDDTPENIDLLREILADRFHLKIATNGEKALQLAENALPDLILLDVMMPGMDGFEVCHRLKRSESTREIPVIFLTALTEAFNEDRGFESGCVDYIGKPISPSVVLARVKTHVALRRARLELMEWNHNLKGRVLGLSSLAGKNMQMLGSAAQSSLRDHQQWLQLMVRLLDMLDADLPNHASRVADMAVATARHLNCSAAETENIRVAALLHDIGKIGMAPDAISRDPDRLSGNLKRVYLTHAVRGQFLLSGLDWLNDAGVLIRHHHEHMNGSGTPDFLEGAEIPLGSRIIAIADYVDRATNHLRSGSMLYSTLQKMQVSAGRRFDPELLVAFAETAAAMPQWRDAKKEPSEMVAVQALIPGMTMREDLYTGSRILLIEYGKKVTPEIALQIGIALKIDAPACAKVLVSRPDRLSEQSA